MPLETEGGIGEVTLARSVDELVAAGMHGLTPLGSTGGIAFLGRSQQERIVEVVIEAAAGRTPVVPSVATTTTADAARQPWLWEPLGASGVLALRRSLRELTQAFAR